jgi:CRP-like cAMP-binding protein
VRVRGDSTVEERVAQLRALDLFASLADTPLKRLARALVDLRYPGGAAIVREGEEGEYFYVIVAGEVEIVRGTRLIAVRGRGEYFGEVALLRGSPRTASAFARTALSIYALDGPTFVVAVNADPRSRRVAAVVVAERLGP